MTKLKHLKIFHFFHIRFTSHSQAFGILKQIETSLYVSLFIQIPGQRVAVHLKFLCQAANADALVQPGANIVFPVVKSFSLPAFSERTSQLDSSLFFCSQRLARTL